MPGNGCLLHSTHWTCTSQEPDWTVTWSYPRNWLTENIPRCHLELVGSQWPHNSMYYYNISCSSIPKPLSSPNITTNYLHHDPTANLHLQAPPSAISKRLHHARYARPTTVLQLQPHYPDMEPGWNRLHRGTHNHNYNYNYNKHQHNSSQNLHPNNLEYRLSAALQSRTDSSWPKLSFKSPPQTQRWQK